MSKVKTPTSIQPSKLPVTTTTTRFRRSPITLLKEECLELRKKTNEDELLIEEQAKEIERIKQLLQKNKKKENDKKVIQSEKKTDELISSKSRLKKILSSNGKESSSINKTDKKNMSEISPSGKIHFNLQVEIEKLKKQLDMQEHNYQIRIEGLKKLLEEKNGEIQKYQEQINKTKVEHANEINQIKSHQQEEYSKLERQYQEQNLCKEKLEKNTERLVQDELERILYEFEQEEHNIRAMPVKNKDCGKNYQYRDSNQPISVKLNQQWWTQKFVPTDAVSWPSPQPLSNLKKVSSSKGLRM